MIEFIAGALCLGMAGMMLLTSRLLSRISKLEEQVQDFVSEVKEEFKRYSVEEISFPRGVNGIEKYSDSETIFLITSTNSDSVNLITFFIFIFFS